MPAFLLPRSIAIGIAIALAAGAAVHAEIVLPTAASDALIEAEAAAAELPPANDPGAPPRLTARGLQREGSCTPPARS